MYILYRLRQYANAYSPIAFSDSGKITLLRFLHALNVELSILVRDCDRPMLLRLSQLANPNFPITVNESGKSILLRFVQ